MSLVVGATAEKRVGDANCHMLCADVGFPSAGDFILHLAGIDDKRVYLEHALEEANAQWTHGPKLKPIAQGRKHVT